MIPSIQNLKDWLKSNPTPYILAPWIAAIIVAAIILYPWN